MSFVIVPHIGKSHLTYQTLASIPDTHHVVLVDASYVADMDCYAELHRATVSYIRPSPSLTCLARNWNIGAAAIPASEPWWLFAASDVQFYAESWRRLAEFERCYPDAGIIRDADTNWNVWLVRRWAWELLAPMDEAYTPCGGEDDDIVMKCASFGIRIRAAHIGVNHLEGGHATRLDIFRPLAGTTWEPRKGNIGVFKEKWGCIPSIGKDPIYGAAHRAIHIPERRSDPPATWTQRMQPAPFQGPCVREWPKPLKLNIGCGKHKLPGYVNIDTDPRWTPDLRMDAGADPWPWTPGTVERIEAYHLIEHLEEDAAKALVKRAFDYLAPGGVLVLECPDLAALCRDYPKSTRRVRRQIFGYSAPYPMHHQFGYCPQTMALMLKEIGFEKVTVGPGTDYHTENCPCLRAEATR